MKTINNPSNFRSKITDYLYDEIKHHNHPNIKVMARNIEKSIYNYSLDRANDYKIIKRWDNRFFVQIYLDKFKMLYYSLKNEIIQNKLLSGEIKSREFAYLSHQKMNPEYWDKLLEDRKIRMENKYFPKIEASTDQFTCRRCKSNKCTYYQMQTRSGDEATTIFVTCLTCSNSWRQS